MRSCALLGALALVLGGCDARGEAETVDGAAESSAAGAAAAAEAAAGPAAEGLIAGTPEGGLAEWVAEIQSGLAPVPAQAATDPAAALQTVMDLYITRQEYIELYYGADRPLYAGEALDAEVEEAEARFHALMQLLQRQPPPERQEVADAVSAVIEQESAVLSAAREAGATLDPRASAVASGPSAEGAR